VCIDANAAARNAAQQRWAEKDAKYRSESLKYWNRETSAVRGMQRAATGYSRSVSNDYQRALYVQGQARKAYQAGFIKYQQTKGSVNEGGRDRRASKKGLVALTRARGQLDNAVQREFGVQMQRRYRARLLKMQNFQAKTRESLGIRPEYGAPVMMPPSDRLSGALSIASTIVGLATGVGDLSKMFSPSVNSGLSNVTAKGLSNIQGISSNLNQALQAPITVGGGILGADPFADYITGGINS